MTAHHEAPDMVNHPPHYAMTRIECIDAIGAMTEPMPGEAGYLAGSVLKYLWRHRQKAPVESLQKARWYLDRLIACTVHEEAMAETARRNGA
jgi:hypothetical protein